MWQLALDVIMKELCAPSTHTSKDIIVKIAGQKVFACAAVIQISGMTTWLKKVAVPDTSMALCHKNDHSRRKIPKAILSELFFVNSFKL